MIVWTAAWVIFLLLLLQIIYRYLMKPYQYWSDRGVPSVPAVPVFGNVLQTFSKPFRDVLLEWHRKHGRIFGYYEGSRPVLFLADPDLLKDVLVKDFHIFPDRRDRGTGDKTVANVLTSVKGEEWKRIRTIITPMTSIMKQSAEVTAKYFEKYAETGKPADMKRIFNAFTLDVITKSAFGTVLDFKNDPENEFFRVFTGGFSRGISLRLIIYLIFPKLLNPFRTSYITSKSTKYIENIIVNIIKQRRETGQVKNDFLQLLIEANDEVTRNKDTTHNEEEDADKRINDFGHDDVNHHVFKPVKKYKGLTDDEMIAQCAIFIVAGYDTTASAISAASYLLALNPECQEKVIEEIDDVLRQNKADLTYEGVKSMKYLENVISETLRLYSPIVAPMRVASDDYKLGNTGIVIPKGVLVTIPVHSIHYDPKYYEEPEKFNPDRFLPEAKAQRHPYAYLPFGAGPRNCIGMRFAIMEIKFCLAVLLSRFRFKRCSETKVPLEFLKGLSVLQPIGIVLTVENRKDKVEGVSSSMCENHVLCESEAR